MFDNYKSIQSFLPKKKFYFTNCRLRNVAFLKIFLRTLTFANKNCQNLTE